MSDLLALAHTHAGLCISQACASMIRDLLILPEVVNDSVLAPKHEPPHTHGRARRRNHKHQQLAYWWSGARRMAS